MPHRLQRRRTKGWWKPPGTVCVDRSSRWGNPFAVEAYGREQALWLFGAWLATRTTEELRVVCLVSWRISAR